MRNTIEGAISILDTLLLRFTAMLDPVLATEFAIFIRAALGTHEFARSHRQLHET